MEAGTNWPADGLLRDTPVTRPVTKRGAASPLSTYQLGRYFVAAAASALSSSSRSSSGARAALSTVQPPGSTGGRDREAASADCTDESGGRELRVGVWGEK